MLKKLIRGLFSVAGLIIGYVVGDAIAKIDKVQSLGILSKTYGSVLFIVLICLLFGLIFYLISPAIYTAISNLIDYIEKNIQKLTISEIAYGAIGALITLIITTLLTRPVMDFHPIMGPLLVVLINVIAAIIGMDIMIKKKDDITNILVGLKKNSSVKEKKTKTTIKTIPLGLAARSRALIRLNSVNCVLRSVAQARENAAQRQRLSGSDHLQLRCPESAADDPSASEKFITGQPKWSPSS